MLQVVMDTDQPPQWIARDQGENGAQELRTVLDAVRFVQAHPAVFMLPARDGDPVYRALYDAERACLRALIAWGVRLEPVMD